MKEYLSREFVLSCVDNFLSKTGMPIAAQYFYDCFRESEPEDVQPVKHGVWRTNFFSKTIYCSNCKVPWTNSFKYMLNDFKYCPKCGARMDGETNE